MGFNTDEQLRFLSLICRSGERGEGRVEDLGWRFGEKKTLGIDGEGGREDVEILNMELF